MIRITFRIDIYRFAMLLVSSVLTSHVLAEDITTRTLWHEPHRDGRVATSTTWPDRLEEQTLGQVWIIPLEATYSGPFVSEDLVSVTETETKVLKTSDGSIVRLSSNDGSRRGKVR